jgi:protocatechuate 3,4-dioxygenase beta subunit
MRPLHLLVAALVLAVAGIAWLWFSSGEKTNASASAALPHGQAAAPDAAPTPAALDAVQPAATTPSNERVAIDAVPAAQPPKAAPAARKDLLAVTGEVHDASGKPVAGAKVLAVFGRDGFFGELPLDIDDSSSGGPRRRDRLEATTDAAGRFELANARPGSLQLAVRAAGCAPYDARDIHLPAEQRHDLGVITLEAAVTLDGRVVDSRGRAIVGARVQRTPEQRDGFVLFEGFRRPGITVATTRGDGTFSADQLPSGPCSLRVLSDDHPDKTESVTSSRPGERLPSMTIVLDDGFEISGRVVGAPPDQIATLRVNASPARGGTDEGDAGMAFEIPAAGGETRVAQCDGAGNFTLRGLRDGKSYSLRALREANDGDYFGGGVSKRVIARTGDRGVELAYRPESALVFDVVDARTQEPIEDFTAEAGIEWREPFGARDGQSSRNHPGGHLRFEGLRVRSATDKASLAINAVGYAKFVREDITLQPGADTNLGVIALQPVPVTKVTVLDDASGEPVQGARVTLRKVPEPQPDNGGTFAARSVSLAVSSDSGADDGPEFGDMGDDDVVRGKTDEHGVATLTSFEGVRCTLAVVHGEHAPYRSEEFTCAVGAPEERTARLQRGGAVRVTLVDSEGVAVAGGRVEHRAPDAEEGTMMFNPESNAKDVTNAEGSVLFSHLAPGTHRFRPRGAGQGGVFDGGNFSFAVAGMPDAPRDKSWSEVEVADGATAELKLVAPKQVALTGLVRESGAPLSGARLSLRARAKDGERDGMPMFFGGGPQAKTDGKGHYEFANVKAGEYTLTVDHATRQMPSELNLTVGESDTTFNVDLSVATIEGRITGSDNKPVAGVRVSVERSYGEGGARQSVGRVMVMRTVDSGGDTMTFGDDGSGGNKPALTDADGRYFLRGVITDVDIVVKGEAKGYQSAKTEAFKVHANDARSGIDLSLKAAGRIEVSAFKADGSPANMIFVTASPDAGGEAGAERKQSFIQDTGKTVLEGLSPGKWRVSARAVGPEARDGAGAPPEQVVEVTVDKPTTVRFDIP